MDPVSWSVKLIEQGAWGVDLYDQIAKLNVRAVRMAALCEQLPDPESRVTLSDKLDAIGLPRPELHYVVDDYAKNALAASRDQFTAIFDALGTTQLTHVDAIFGAGHIMGTCRMGTDKSSSVTDSFGRTWDHPNLWLAGSSLFPTTGTANPTLTIAALALRSAPEISKALASTSA
jgi:choline dehydrogenase-like flavoprotein